MYDTLLLQGMRAKLVLLLKEKGITDQKVLDSIGKVPRHLFTDRSLERIAYEDRSLEILCSQTISQPSTVAFQTQLLNIKNRDKVLEIGTGSGYQTAVLYNLTSRIYTIERQKSLYENARKVFDMLNIHPQCFFGDGYLGLPGFAPFDKILVTCGAPQVPQNLINQLKTGGMMVIPVGENSHTMYRITKVSDHELKSETFGDYKFVPMLKNKC
ncbi:MAG: protein-L-isoaspartate(D-aspartate) O-methyltransferase [Bacteroidales bacterium]|nr:protein-L-isoaspartate(D-aspartate) O-methyltransferase [Bacteroidales bacterium]MBQ7984432.1 protein-L-isoaspartate(D-aspartate) O-methyltransferase [Bacteroidales bacterium]